MESIKEAFIKVKQDVFSLREELFSVRKEMAELKKILKELISVSEKIAKKEERIEFFYKKTTPTQKGEIQTKEKTIPTDNLVFKPSKPQNKVISIGNEGVPTDRQTDRQTNQQTHFSRILRDEEENLSREDSNSKKNDSFKQAVEALESLDSLKKELRIKFKRLTDKEILVFSTLYQIEEERGYADYKSISKKLNLTESSIRDYVGKLIKKEVPVEKIKINNKTIQLKISPNLKKIASLSTILTLRDI